LSEHRDSQQQDAGQEKFRLERCPYILQVDLETLSFGAAAPDVGAAWYETVVYFVSLHPSCAWLPSLQVPHSVPTASEAGHHLVFKPQAASPQLVQGAQEIEGAIAELSVVSFRERLS